FHKDIKHVLVRNEQGAAFMAQGWARTRKEIGVCCATSGPGATNLVTGIADAHLDSIPILCITGQVPLQMIGKDMFQEVDMTGVTLNITKHNFLLEDPSKAVYTVSEAIKIALSGRPGPVHIDVPKDVMACEFLGKREIPNLDFSDTDPMDRAYKALPISTLDTILKVLNEAKAPMLLVGHGVKHSNGEEDLKKLVNKLGIPTVTTILAKGILHEDDPNYIGMIGMHGFYHSNMATHEADVILNIGSRFDDRIVGRYDAFGRNAVVIHVDIDLSELNKVVDTQIPVHSDAKKFIDQLLSHPEIQKLHIEDWWKQIRKWEKQKKYEKETNNFSIRSCLFDLQNIINEDPDKYILVTDVGQHQMWAMLSLSIPHSTSWLTSGGSGTMGFSLPTAIGAAFANPKKTVICVCGDGGIQMNIQELALLAEHKLNIKVLVLNNNYLGMVRQWQELFYDDNYSAVKIFSPDYKKLAHAYQIKGETITNKKDTKEILNKYLKNAEPCVLEFKVEKEDNVFPMVPGGKTLADTIINS
ncbi:acetolactate synthase, large subunit, biosynthetic type, partial [Candidatus Peregrinibacteria bacterium RIFOXYA2_FULL_33_7]